MRMIYFDMVKNVLNSLLLANGLKTKEEIEEAYKEVDDEFHTAEASMRCNKKGWGNDYFIYIIIEPLYTEAW